MKSTGKPALRGFELGILSPEIDLFEIVMLAGRACKQGNLWPVTSRRLQMSQSQLNTRRRAWLFLVK